MNRSKTPLTLMEQVIMIGLFALAAAVCLQVFVYTGTGSRRLAQEEEMLSLARSVAEMYRSGDRSGAERLGLVWSEDGELLSQDTGKYTVSVTRTVQEKSYWVAEVRVRGTTGDPVILTVSGQTGGERYE